MMRIRGYALSDVGQVKSFADANIGQGYFSEAELEAIYHRSQKGGLQCSLVLEDEQHRIRGVRITYPPGHWPHGKRNGLSPRKWGVEFKDVAYFQSLFLDPPLTGQGWGPRLSRHAIQVLLRLGTKAVVAHSWKESPHASSGRYLRALGFTSVATYPNYWRNTGASCVRCGQLCDCTAEEMILKL